MRYGSGVTSAKGTIFSKGRIAQEPASAGLTPATVRRIFLNLPELSLSWHEKHKRIRCAAVDTNIHEGCEQRIQKGMKIVYEKEGGKNTALLQPSIIFLAPSK